MTAEHRKVGKIMDGWWIFALIGLWLVLQVWVLPKLGVKT
jgi:hypothetical protein